MRERVEDLGRLAVFLEEMARHNSFDRITSSWARADKFVDYYMPPECNPDTKEIWIERLSSLYRDLDDLAEKLERCLEIAQGEDPLNRKPDGE